MDSTDIFRFMFVNSFDLKDAKEIENNSFKVPLSDTTFSKNVLKNKQQGSINNIFSIAQSAIESESVFTNLNGLYANFSEETVVLNWLKDKTDSVTVKNILSKSKKVKANKEYLNKLKDSFLVHSILANPIGILEPIISLLRFHELLKKIEKKEIAFNSQIRKLLQASAVLPSEIFPLTGAKEKVSMNKREKAKERAEDSNIKLKEEITKLQNAKNELVELHNRKNAVELAALPVFEDFNKQITPDETTDKGPATDSLRQASAIKKGVNPGPNPQLLQFNRIIEQRKKAGLTNEDIQQLSEQSQQVISNLATPKQDVIDIPTLVNKIDQFTGSYSNRLATVPGYIAEHIDNGIVYQTTGYNDEGCLSSTTDLTYCQLLSKLRSENPQTPFVNVLGKGEYKVIRQTLYKYEPGEVAQIKNVFAGETFETSHRDFKRTEEITERESEKETQRSNELSTTDRFEVSSEISKEIKKSSEKEFGLNMSASYGPVTIGANASFNSSSSSSQNTKTASNYAKETTQKALENIREKIREKRTMTTINEVEIINKYSLTNISTEHKTGIYRWVDKYYENQLYNIGLRLMLEFYIPSPMAFYIFSRKGSSGKGITAINPIPPSTHKIDGIKLSSHKALTRDNYHLWVTAYNVRDFTPPPAEYQTLQKSFHADVNNSAFSEKIVVPEGYQAFKIIHEPRIVGWHTHGEIYAGLWGWNSALGGEGTIMGETVLPDIEDELYVSGMGTAGMYCFIQLRCKLSAIGFETWQIKIYKAIMEAYENTKSEYDNQIAIAKLRAGVSIEGNNPDINRKIEQEELQKWCTEAMTFDRFENWNAMKKATTGEPEIDFNQAKAEAPIVSFFNSAFEWGNMTYKFYPYFYNNKADHPAVRELADVDPKFMDALRAGYARVIVPVTPGFDNSVLHFLETGQVWNGGGMPVLDDPLFISIAEEIKGKEYDNIGVAEDEPWITKVPTSLIWLQADSTLPDNS